MSRDKKQERKVVFMNKYTEWKTIEELFERLNDPKVWAPAFKLAKVLDFKSKVWVIE